MGVSTDNFRSWVPRPVLEQARATLQDIAHIAACFRGEGPPPFQARGASAPSPGPVPVPVRAASAVITRRLRVLSSELCTPSALAIAFETEDGQPLGADAGQFLTVHWPLNGVVEKRAYSLASRADDGTRGRLVVKGAAGGRVSASLVARAGELRHLEVTGPSGHFVLDVRSRRHVFLAAGSGITPIASMLLTHVPLRKQDTFTLVYGSTSPEETILRRELLDLANEFPERFSIRWAFDQNANHFRSVPPPFSGALGGDLLTEILRAQPVIDLHDAAVYLCGPSPMMKAAQAVLDGANVPPARIRTERFASPGSRNVGPQNAVAGAVGSVRRVALRVILDGKTQEIIASTAQTILEAGLGAGLPMPYSCSMGGCASCRVHVTSGMAVMEEPNCLEAEEQRQGYVLACCTRPTSDLTVEVS